MKLTDRIAPWGPAIIGAYLIGKMAYVFGQGAAQPADILFAALALLIVPPRPLARFLIEEKPFALLLGWVSLVSIVWAVLRAEPLFLRGGVYLAFNVLAVATVVGARERDPARFDTIVTRFLLASVVIQFLAVLIIPAKLNDDFIPREVGTFFNPNQLGYWAICSMSLWLVLRRGSAKLLDLVVLAMLGVIQVLTLSRAGIGAMAIGLMVWAWFALTPKVRYGGLAAVVAVLAIAAAIPAVRQAVTSSEFYAGLNQRMHKSDVYSSPVYRNFGRAIEHPQYLAFGAGEADYDRFSKEEPKEVHGTLGGMLFGYGVIGLGLLAWLFLRIVLAAPIRATAQLIAPAVYSGAHNGLRFVFFWILVAVLLSLARQRAQPSR